MLGVVPCAVHVVVYDMLGVVMYDVLCSVMLVVVMYDMLCCAMWCSRCDVECCV